MVLPLTLLKALPDAAEAKLPFKAFMHKTTRVLIKVGGIGPKVTPNRYGAEIVPAKGSNLFAVFVYVLLFCFNLLHSDFFDLFVRLFVYRLRVL